MRKNIIKAALEHYYIQVGDEFTVSCSPDKFKLATPVKVQRFNRTENTWEDASTFEYILAKTITGDVNIEVLPFVPELLEEYYTYEIDSDDRWYIIKRRRTNNFYYHIAQKAGCVFKDIEKAKLMLPIRFKELTGKNFVELDTYECIVEEDEHGNT